MKTRIVLIMCALLALMPGMAQKYKMVLCLSNGMTVEHYVDDLDSIYWVVEDNEPDISDYSEPVTTGNATDVGVYAAKVSAWANNLNGKDDATTVVGVIYCMDGTPTQNNGKRATVGIAEIGDDGKYDVALADLAPATTYYYRAFMNVGGTYVYGKVCSFVTEGQGIGFTTGVATDVTSYSANITSGMSLGTLEYSTLTYGVCYAMTSDPSADDGVVLAKGVDGDGRYTVSLTALAGDTVYYYRPYAVMDGYVSYGLTSAFRTSGDKVVATGEIDSVSLSVPSLLNMGMGTYRTLKIGVCYSRGEVPTISDFNVEASDVDDENIFTVTLPLTVDTWYYRAYAVIDGTPHYGDVRMFVLESSDTREAVDLGLSVKWASCNVGATEPTEYGDYFAWAMTEGYEGGNTTFNWASYAYCNGAYNRLTKYCNDATYGRKDGLLILEQDDDAAVINWGAKWRVPTEAEMTELREKCKWRMQPKGNVKYNGVAGYEVTGPNGNTIFLPSAGYRYNSSLRSAGSAGRYWTNSISEVNPSNARCFDFTTGMMVDKARYYGFSIRAVSE